MRIFDRHMVEWRSGSEIHSQRKKTHTAGVVPIFTVSFAASGVTCCNMLKVPFKARVILMSIFFDILLIEG